MIFRSNLNSELTNKLMITYVTALKNFSSQSWSCPVVIFDDMPIRGPPADEDPVPVDGNPHPRPQEQFHHPN